MEESEFRFARLEGQETESGAQPRAAATHFTPRFVEIGTASIRLDVALGD